MNIEDTLYFPDRKAWRNWLREHHALVDEVWLRYYKVSSGRETMAYGESVEEALCYGWIDGKIKTVDESCYVRRFTPRKPGSRWSGPNIERIRKLDQEGRMTAVGRARIDPAILADPGAALPREPELPPEFEERIRAVPRAGATLDRLTAAQRRNYARWLTQAKKEETRQRRLAQAIEKLAAGVKNPV